MTSLSFLIMDKNNVQLVAEMKSSLFLLEVATQKNNEKKLFALSI